MEGRLNIVLGVFLVILVVATGRNLLLKKTGKKLVKAETSSSVAKTSGAETETKSEEKKSDATTRVAQSEVKTEVTETKTEIKAIAAPVKLTLMELEKMAQEGLCNSSSESDFCTKMKDSVSAFKGARLKDDQVYIFVDNNHYFQKAQGLSMSSDEVIDPAASNQADSMGAPPAANMGNSSVSASSEKKSEIASALLLRDLMTNVKQEIRSKNLTIIFQKDPMSPMSPPTFALNCSGNSLANQSSDVFSDDNLKAGKVDYSSFCQLN